MSEPRCFSTLAGDYPEWSKSLQWREEQRPPRVLAAAPGGCAFALGGCSTVATTPAFHRVSDREPARGHSSVRTSAEILPPSGHHHQSVPPWRIASNSFTFVVLLGLFAALPAVSIDFSAPTLPLLPKALGTNVTIAGLTLSLFMVGFALGQLMGGVLSDRRGRRPLLLAGLACFTIAGLACASSPCGLALLSARFIQGLGAGTCSVVSFAMVQDLFEGDIARSKRSTMLTILGAAPILAPAFGSLLIKFAGWRAVHGSLAIAGSLLWAVSWGGVAESGRHQSAPAVSRTRGMAARLWRDPEFVGFTLANALSYGMIFAYIAGSPIVIIGEMRLSSAVFAGIFACTAIALTAGAWTSGRLSRRGFTATALLGPSLMGSVLATLALAAASLAGSTAGVILLPPLLLTLFTRGAIAPNLQHLAVDPWREHAGMAMAAVGVLQLLSGAATSAVVALFLPHYGLRAVTIPMALLAIVALLIWCWTTWRGGQSADSAGISPT